MLEVLTVHRHAVKRNAGEEGERGGERKGRTGLALLFCSVSLSAALSPDMILIRVQWLGSIRRES